MRRTQALLAAGILALAGLCRRLQRQVVLSWVERHRDGHSDRHGALVHRARGDRDDLRAHVEAAKIGPGAPTRRVEFGHIQSLKRSEDGYVLRFDPAEYLTGVTASDAMQEDTGSSDVPNDNYVVDEGHRLFTYNVPADAHVTVLADGVEGTPITVAQLAKIVKSGEPLGHPLFEPLETGVWILIEVDTVRSIDQQYVP